MFTNLTFNHYEIPFFRLTNKQTHNKKSNSLPSSLPFKHEKIGALFCFENLNTEKNYKQTL